MQQKEWDKLTDHQRYTARYMHIIFTETKMYLPFASHPKFIDMLEILEGKTGFHGKHKRAPPALARFISSDMHEVLLKSLIATKMPMSLIMDTATDTLGHVFL